jgi:Zn-dependent protease with chaperone function/Flp pilus assembly protein TadD
VRTFMNSTLVGAAFALLALASPAAGETDAEVDDRLTAELSARNPDAAEVFAQGNAARLAEKHEEAAALFGRVTRMAPDFSHAWRREGYALLAMDRRETALDRMRSAVSVEVSPWNLIGLASALITGPPGKDPSEVEVQEAVRLVRQAEVLDSKDATVARTACQLALMTQNFDWLESAARRLVAVEPGDPWAHFFLAVHSAVSGDKSGAKRSITQAKALGLPDEVHRNFLTQLERDQPPTSKLMGVALPVLGAWLGGFLVLLVVGSVLSRITLETSRRVPSQESGRAAGLDAILRRAYGYVLWACCAYYFVSIPLIVAAVLLTAGGIIYVMFQVGHVPIKLLALVVIVTLVTLWAMVRGLVVRARDEDPGYKVEPDEHPRLRRVLDDVAGKIGTRPVTNVYITPGTEMAVMERGGVFKQIGGHTERCLILGIGALEGMKIRPFRAILAHEYGHFSNRDTAGGGFALAVRRSLINTAVHLAKGGAAAWYNPAWLFVNGFYRLFLRISQGASRLQEVLADRWAAFSYGARSFEQGLRHIIERSVRFDAHVNSVLQEVVEAKKPLVNLYSYRSTGPIVEEANVAEAIEAAIHREPSPYDSHPRPVDRFAWVHALGSRGGPDEPDDTMEAWTLFDDRESLERRLTEVVRGNIRQDHGIEIPSDEVGAELEPSPS